MVGKSFSKCHLSQKWVNYLRSEGTHLKIEIISSAKENSKMMFRRHVLNLQINRIKKVSLGLAYQHVLFAAKVCMCYTEQQQESSVLATINLEKQKWKTFDESYSLFFLLLNVCTYVHDCDLTPIWCRRHLPTEKLK